MLLLEKNFEGQTEGSPGTQVSNRSSPFYPGSYFKIQFSWKRPNCAHRKTSGPIENLNLAPEEPFLWGMRVQTGQDKASSTSIFKWGASSILFPGEWWETLLKFSISEVPRSTSSKKLFLFLICIFQAKRSIQQALEQHKFEWSRSTYVQITVRWMYLRTVFLRTFPFL